MSTSLTKATGTSAVDRNYDFFPTIMGKTAWDDLFLDFFNDFDKFWGKEQVIPCDVIQHKDDNGNITATEIQYALAGYDKKDVSIRLDGDTLLLSVEKTEKIEDAKKGKEYVHRGISHRRIEASYNINGYDKNAIEASLDNGILKLKLPALPKSEAKKIEIK